MKESPSWGMKEVCLYKPTINMISQGVFNDVEIV